MEEDYFIKIENSAEVLRKMFKLKDLIRSLRMDLDTIERFRQLKWSRKVLIEEKLSEIMESLKELERNLPERKTEEKEGKVEEKVEEKGALEEVEKRKEDLERIKEELTKLREKEEREFLPPEEFQLLIKEICLVTKNLGDVDLKNLVDSQMNLDAKKVEEKVNEFLKIVKKNKSIGVTQLAKFLDVDKKIVEEWGRILKEHDLVDIEHPVVSEVVFKER